MPKYAINYSKTIMYKIVCNDLKIIEKYIGHTTNFVKRKCQHKYCCINENSDAYNFKIYQTIRDNGGWDNWSMVQICLFPCGSLQEAIAEERRYCELLNACMNTINPYRTKKEKMEYEKLYKQKNKDLISKKQKIYYDENKEIISKKNKIYREKNMYYEKNKDKILENTKKWREKNKDRIKQYGRERYEKNKNEKEQSKK